MTTQPGNRTAEDKIWVTLAGLPLTVELKWPFHRSESGADFWVLHTDIRPAWVEGLHALVSVNLSVTVKEVLASLEPGDVEAPVINALRKEVDRRQIEFLKSAKLVPIPFSSRHYDFKRNKWAFGRADDARIAEFVARKVFWQTKLGGAGKVWVADPVEVQYLDTTAEHLLEVAGTVAGLRLEGAHAVATGALMAQAAKFEGDMQHALEELEKKHAFERA
jgi:hypothetical protein